MPALTVVVPATNAPSTLYRCLGALAASDEPPDEVVVVSEPARAGPAEARNAGARRAGGDVLVFVDSDVLVAPDALTRIRLAFAREPGLVGVFGSYDDRVATEGTVAAFRNLLHHTVHQRSAGPVVSFWSGLGAVRREAFAEAGGFDASRYAAASIEDVELGWRLSQLGQIVLDPDLRGTHLKEWTFREMVRTDYARRGVPWVRLALERGSLPRTLNIGLREQVSTAAAVGVVGGVVTRRATVAAGFAAAHVALNRDLYALLMRRAGVRAAAFGAALHLVHHLTATAAVAGGLVAHLRRARGRPGVPT